MRVNFEENLVKFGQILRPLEAPNRRSMSLEVKIRDFKRDINSWVHFSLTLTFFSYFFFSFTFSSQPLLPSPQSRYLLLPTFAWCRFLFSLVLFESLLFTNFARIHLAPFSASSTFVWYAQVSWLSRLNTWFDIPCIFSLQEVSNFVKFIKNGYKFIFDPNFLSTF